MDRKIYFDNERCIAGLTMKDEAALESNNMALHACSDPALILQNRHHFAESFGTELKNFVCANQTHSAKFFRAEKTDKGRGAFLSSTDIPETDALYTYEPGIMLTSFAADCVPIVFYHETSGLIGAVHSGWQGTVKEIALKLFRHLIQAENCSPEGFRVQIGAALSQDRFEVDEDVYLKFKALGYADAFMYFKEATGKYHIDNQAAVKKQIELAGIPEEWISIDRTCTFDSPQGFSYRQDKKCGRHMAFIMKKQ
jgi:YfiH family protein